MNKINRINLPISKGSEFEDFLKNKKIKFTDVKRDWEIFRIITSKNEQVPFFVFESTRTIECFDNFGQELIREFYKINLYA